VKLVTVFFDLEGPFLWRDVPKFDIEKVVKNISDVLVGFGIKAVFNTCGLVAERFPRSIAMLHDEGHEIASHGYAHENFSKVPLPELDALLARTERVFEHVFGEEPIGVRAPWLARSESIYDIYRKRKYRWTSNLNVPFWVTRSRVDFGSVSYPRWVIGKAVYEVRRLGHKEEPFKKDSLVEIPLVSPLDVYCIYPYPQVGGDSPESSLEEAYRILVSHYRSSKKFFNLNFHEHSIGTGNRLRLLERVLSFLSEQSDVSFILASKLVSSIG